MNKNGSKRVNNIREQGLDTADNHFGDKLVDCVKKTYRFEVFKTLRGIFFGDQG